MGKTYDVLKTWREKALNVQGNALACGHLLQEEAPDALLQSATQFLGAC